MAEICCGVASDSEATNSCEPNTRAARRRRMEIRRFRFVPGVGSQDMETGHKRPRMEIYPESFSSDFENEAENCDFDEEKRVSKVENRKSNQSLKLESVDSLNPSPVLNPCPKVGFASVCGRRRDMEDAVAIHPSFCSGENQIRSDLHYFGVYDGHGCSHVSTKCSERLHEVVKEELERKEESTEWTSIMERSFMRMDNEAIAWSRGALAANCKCELQTPACDAVGSTAVVAIVTPEKIILANCGDSRAVLCRNGKAIPLSSDHKPDRPDELNRIEASGGRVIYWDCPRVLGVLAMSRAIGDNYLKPYVICVPEVTITDRSPDDEFLILASDGLWDVISNDTACGVARMCLQGKFHAPPCAGTESGVVDERVFDKTCSDASMLLTKLALARNSTDNVSVVVVDLRRDT